MREAGNKASVSHDMSTTNRGSILPSERAERAWPPGRGGLKGRNAFQEPEDFIVGSHGCIGGGDPRNTNDLDGDFDGGPWDDGGYGAAPDPDGAWEGGS
jgi:hypothetical protein